MAEKGRKKGSVTLAPSKPYRNNVVGLSVKVYWPLEETWYSGKVADYQPATPNTPHLIKYHADGEQKWHHLVALARHVGRRLFLFVTDAAKPSSSATIATDAVDGKFDTSEVHRFAKCKCGAKIGLGCLDAFREAIVHIFNKKLSRRRPSRRPVRVVGSCTSRSSPRRRVGNHTYLRSLVSNQTSKP